MAKKAKVASTPQTPQMDVEQVLKESAASFKAAMLVVEQARATIAFLKAEQANFKLN